MAAGDPDSGCSRPNHSTISGREIGSEEAAAGVSAAPDDLLAGRVVAQLMEGAVADGGDGLADVLREHVEPLAGVDALAETISDPEIARPRRVEEAVQEVFDLAPGLERLRSS